MCSSLLGRVLQAVFGTYEHGQNCLHALFAVLAAIVDGGAAHVHSSAETGIYIRTMELLSGMRASGLGQNKVSVFEPQYTAVPWLCESCTDSSG